MPGTWSDSYGSCQQPMQSPMQHQPSLTSVSWHPQQQQALALQQQPTASAPPVLRSSAAIPIGADLSSNASTAYEQVADASAAVGPFGAGFGDQMAMDDDVSAAAGVKPSSSAPDLHLLLDGALQGGPRSLLAPRQHFSGSTVGALVPYKGTEVRLAVRRAQWLPLEQTAVTGHNRADV